LQFLKINSAPHIFEQTESMKNCKCKTGLTLIEILIVVALIAILAAMVIRVAARIGNQAKERLAKSTIATVNAALEQFRDYGYSYKDPYYNGLVFPLDCNGFSQIDLENVLGNALGATAIITPVGSNDPNYSGSEALYFFLSRVPQCRETLDRIDKSLITNKDKNNQYMTIDIDGELYPLFRIIDPWGITLRYSYYRNQNETSDEPIWGPPYNEKRNFPIIVSAGPDRKFRTGDDIKSR